MVRSQEYKVGKDSLCSKQWWEIKKKKREETYLIEKVICKWSVWKKQRLISKIYKELNQLSIKEKRKNNLILKK